MSSFTNPLPPRQESARPARVITVFGTHRRVMRAGAVTQHTQARHVGEHHHGWSTDATCPRCYPSAYALDSARHRAEGVAR